MRTLWGAFLGSAAAMLLAAAPALAQTAPPSPPAPVLATASDAAVAQRVQAVLDQLKGRPEFVGLSVAIARGDHVILDEGVGIADLEWNVPADADTLMRIGSVTKQFTAAAIMKLHEQGRIGLDDPLARYLPEFDTQGRTVTIRQLLNHSSGLPNYTAQKSFAERMSRFDLGEKDWPKLVAGVPFDFEPGTKWQYSNTNFFLLGMIVEKISGQSYADYMEANFFRPLGLTHTRYDDGAQIIPKRASGYEFDSTRRRPVNTTPINMSWPGGAGALISTAGDLLRWQIALTGGRAVSAASFQQMIAAPVKTGNGDEGYGFGLVVGRVAGQRGIWHNGAVNGFNSDLVWLPDVGLRVAVISNDMAMPSDLVVQRIFAALDSTGPLPPARTNPQPGGEAFLRKLIADEANDTIDFATMTPPMAELVRAHPAQSMFKAWGSIARIGFVEVGLTGLDVYRVAFDSGAAMLFSILRTPDGKLAAMTFTPAGHS